MKKKKLTITLGPEKFRRRVVLINGFGSSWRIRRGRDEKNRRIWELVLQQPGKFATDAGEFQPEGKVWASSPEARVLCVWLRKVLENVEKRRNLTLEQEAQVAAKDLVR